MLGGLPRGLLLAILPSSPNPDPISDQKMHFSTHFQTWPPRKMSSLLRLEQQQKTFFKI